MDDRNEAAYRPEETLDDIERRLEAIWRRHLSLSEVTADSHFVDLGGDSVAGTLCTIDIRAEFDVDLPLGDLLADSATFRSVAQEIGERRRSHSSIESNSPVGRP